MSRSVNQKNQHTEKNSWYDPQVIATNSSDVPVTITSVELIAGSRTFQNKPRAEKDYPLTLPAHSTVPLDVYFSFSNGAYVAKVFKNPGELRIHYSSQQGTGLAHMTVARGHLNAR